MIEPLPGPFFISGGTMPRDARSYVVRRADHDLVTGLRAGEFCYVLSSRQMGKSSLMVRAAATLQQEGCHVVVLDLSAIGQEMPEEQWCYTLLYSIWQSLGLRAALDAYWRERASLTPVQRWMAALQEVALPALQAENQARLIVFIDEIDAVRSLPFKTDGFFAAIRALYNRRAVEPDLNRLTFCLLGSAAPSDLIKDMRLTPFNIGRRIDLADFTPREAALMAAELSREEAVGAALLERILHWTHGHPYLTQRLCGALLERRQEAQDLGGHEADLSLPRSSFLLPPSSEVDRRCDELFFSSSARTRDSNLLWVRDRMLHSDLARESILLLYDQVRRGRRVRDNEADEQVSALHLAGIVRPVGGLLAVRNRIYERVFDGAWVQDQLPDAFLRKQRAAYRRQLLSLCGVSAIILCLSVSTFVYRRQALQSERRAAQYLTRAEQMLYADDMHLIQYAWETNDIQRVHELLEETRANPARGFEWDYWNRLCHLDLMTLQGHTREISAAAYSPDGSKIVTASWDGTAKVWDVRTGQEILTLKGHTKEVSFAAFTQDGRRIVTGSYDHTAKIWDAATGRELHTVRGCTETIDFSPDCQKIVSGSGLEPSDAEIWDVSSGRKLLTLTGHVVRVEAVSYSPDGKRVVTGGYDRLAKVWDAQTGRELLTIKGHTGPVTAVAFSPDGKRIVTGSVDKTAKVWDAQTGKEILTLQGHAAPVLSVTFSSDGKRIATGSDDHTAKVWDAGTGRELLTLKGHTGRIVAAAFSPDGKTIVTGNWDKTARVWDAQTRQDTLTLRGHTAWGPYSHLEHTAAFFSAAYSPDSRRIVTGEDDCIARVWDAQTGRETLTLRGHTKAVISAAFSPDGTRIVTGSWDDSAKVWNAQAGQDLLTLKGHTDNVRSVAFSPDGKQIITGSDDGTAKVWSAQISL
jgi:WD40 repeat protein